MIYFKVIGKVLVFFFFDLCSFWGIVGEVVGIVGVSVRDEGFGETCWCVFGYFIRGLSCRWF